MLEEKVNDSKLRIVAEFEEEYARQVFERKLAEKEKAISEMDSALLEKEKAISEMDSALLEKEKAISEMDSALHNIEKENILLKAKLKENGISY